ncbi:hypothetical protein Tsp_12175 [Trichinella spiralis]|uniref:hypothetical protein n=1 Tax=Trichinella spiralis TaxID=6334 RepID=UPI0001EFB68D|nr:hypothetical protein Tsp_12175 [Trichinella spiralis]
MSAVEELYLRNGSRPFCRCAMSYNCFRPFICHATSDNKATRETRKVTNKMAAHCVPSKKLTIDEQLHGFRGYILGQIIMLCKPANSRSSEQRQTRLSNTIVEQWAQPFVQSNRNVFMDRYFTSDSIVQHLLERGLIAVGTVYANRRDVP